jgi:hypothetical protein
MFKRQGIPGNPKAIISIISASWLAPKAIVSEANEAYPGIVVKRIGYVPFASDDSGGGDYYYARFTESDDPPVFRYWHDEVDEEAPERCGRREIYPKLSQFIEEAFFDRHSA